MLVLFSFKNNLPFYRLAVLTVVPESSFTIGLSLTEVISSVCVHKLGVIAVEGDGIPAFLSASVINRLYAGAFCKGGASYLLKSAADDNRMHV